jgi:hypothetical protein
MKARGKENAITSCSACAIALSGGAKKGRDFNALAISYGSCLA